MTPSLYEILALPPSFQNASSIPVQTLRTAYRRALLQNHPDKNFSSSLNKDTNTNGAEEAWKYTIDEITHAFNILGDKKARTKYDTELRLQSEGNNGVEGNGAQGFHTGFEVVDLDDLICVDKGIWYRSCRCGQERGFEVTEKDLEEAEKEGERELSVGCQGCSLWMRVLFGVVEEEGQDGE